MWKGFFVSRKSRRQVTWIRLAAVRINRRRKSFFFFFSLFSRFSIFCSQLLRVECQPKREGKKSGFCRRLWTLTRRIRAERLTDLWMKSKSKEENFVSFRLIYDFSSPKSKKEHYSVDLISLQIRWIRVFRAVRARARDKVNGFCIGPYRNRISAGIAVSDKNER